MGIICFLLASTTVTFIGNKGQPVELNPDVAITRDVEYVPGGGSAQSLDLYVPKRDRPVPVIAYIHGGGWESGAKDGCWSLAEANRGYAAVSISYRWSSQARFPAQIQDCQAAIRFLRANSAKYNLDPDRIGVWGDSAGGHLCALLGTAGGKHAFPPIGGNEQQSDRVQAVADWFGPTDFLTIQSQAMPDDRLHVGQPGNPVDKLLGGSIAEHKDLALAASPVHFVSKDNPPFLIEHVAGDPVVPIAQSRELADALRKAGVEVTLVERPGKEHGENMINRFGWLDTIQSFFDFQFKVAGGR